MKLEAVAALPYPHEQQATVALRGELRRQLVDRGIVDPPDWSTLKVVGPETFTDLRGRTWFSWTARLDGPARPSVD